MTSKDINKKCRIVWRQENGLLKNGKEKRKFMKTCKAHYHSKYKVQPSAGGSKIGDFFKDLGEDLLNGAVETIGQNVSQVDIVEKQSENGVGDLLGKYKGWIIGGGILLIGSVVASVTTLMKK